MGALKIANVSKFFGDVEVLKSIDIEIADGEFIILVGPSGCGKSTLMNIIAGLEDLTTGQLELDGEDLTTRSPADRDIAMVFQSYALYPTMNVARNISFGLEMRKVPKAQRDEKVNQIAKMLQIDHLLDRKPSQLSGGQRQRVAMGRALARSPKVYLFDEPLSNLDAKLRVEMRSEIKKLHQRLGTTIVYVTHDQIEAMTLADRIAVMKDGILQQLGTPYEIYNNPANRFVAGFMGSMPMNFVPCNIDNDCLVIESEGKPYRLTLPANIANNTTLQKRAVLGIRPEAITDVESSDTDAISHAIEIKIDLMEPTGADTLASLNINETRVQGRFTPEIQAKVGDQVTVFINMAKAVLFDIDSGERIGI